MRRPLCFTFAVIILLTSPCHAGLFDDLSREVFRSPQQQLSLDNSTMVKGLKEALAVGTERAVNQVARPDGYFRNQLIKILLPDKMQRAANLLGEAGYKKQVDELVISMNRAAEKAAPQAARFFGDAIRQMTVEDAKEVLEGGETAATTFFEKQTRSKLFDAFKPVVAKSMDQVGTARAYQTMLSTFQAVPLASLAGTPALDLNSYVTDKALDGLFVVLGEEEKKIRSNPAAQTTDLLRKVFGNK